MSLVSLAGALETGLVFGLVALAVYLSFRVINFPDLSVDSTFPLGGAVAATMIAGGSDPVLATVAATLAGAVAGLLTAWLNVGLRIMQLLSGILVMIGLYSVNLRIMGKPNVALIREKTVFDLLPPSGLPDYLTKPLLLLILVGLLLLAINLFFTSSIGLAMRATGSNARMARAQGISTDMQTFACLAMSNAIVALAGALFVQSQGGADISMGVGTIITGLAGVFIGETFLSSRSFALGAIACVAGAVAYRFVMAIALDSDVFGLQAQDLNLATAALVTLALTLRSVRKQVKLRWVKIERGRPVTPARQESP